MSHQSFLIGVVSAEANANEQRQLLSGIITGAQKHHAQVLTLSNLYNSLEPEQADSTDNRVYELIASNALDAIILLSESFVNPALQQRICKLLLQKTSVPVVIIGTPLPDLPANHFPNINSSDETDFEELTNHLIEHCGFRQIAMLTGPHALGVSEIRKNGYRKSLEKHGIPYDESLVIEGDFWYSSGEKLAKEYLSGERPEPEALICANDYMAFGVLDAFSAVNEDITKHFSLIGYEFVPERHLHSPLLTTFQRNRTALGAAAVDLIMQKLRAEPEQAFHPPHGVLVNGRTCPGNSAEIQTFDELETARIQRQYADWSLKSQMESRLTECRSIEEFACIMGDFLFMVRGAVDIVLCLFEDWFRPSGSSAHTLLCRSINPWADKTVYSVTQTELPGILRRYRQASAGYLNPVYFKEHLLGYCMAWYEKPNAYDDTYRHWLKSVSNCLEFLRLKGDVRYLLQCRTLSPSYDSMSGVFSADGLRDAFQFMINAQHPQSITAIAFRFCYPQDALNTSESTKEAVTNLLAAVNVMKRFHGKGCIIGRITEFEFLLLFPECAVHPALLADAIKTEIFSDSVFLRYSGQMQLFMHEQTFGESPPDFSLILQQIKAQQDHLNAKYHQLSRLPHYQELHQLHDALNLRPQNEYSLDDAAEELSLNPNHFNRIYKSLIGVSFHRDHILARLRLAKHLLLTTNETATHIAESCGYTDSKYFIRQFSAETGCTPKQYRNLLREYSL